MDWLSPFQHDLMQATPGKGLGLWLGVAGTSFSLLSVLSYTPRNRLTFLQGFGTKRLWLNLHIGLGALGPLLLAAGHAHFHWLGIKGLANLAMWAAVISGLIARFFAAQIPAARLRRERLLERLNSSFNWEEGALYSLTPPKRELVMRAMEKSAGEPPLSLAEMIRLVLQDLCVIALLWGAASYWPRGKWLAGDTRQGDRGTPSDQEFTQLARGVQDRRAPLEAFRARLILQRNLLLLNLEEVSAPFWVAVHKGFSFGFLLLGSLHVTVALLFKT